MTRITRISRLTRPTRLTRSTRLTRGSVPDSVVGTVPCEPGLGHVRDLVAAGATGLCGNRRGFSTGAVLGWMEKLRALAGDGSSDAEYGRLVAVPPIARTVLELMAVLVYKQRAACTAEHVRLRRDLRAAAEDHRQ
mmetsp:Transcript_41073/g.80395  ORF Transcript_41073/g.80395 Transcript_41073/m.80395 type:complete len:136 (+) Transcript_41073:134-541(+)